MKKLLTIICFLALFSFSLAEAATYYVRTDGGTVSQCNGLTDAAEAGNQPDCALEHPNWVLSPQGNNPTLLAADDIMDIRCGDSFMMGYGAPNTSDLAKCDTNYTRDCFLRNTPNGTSSTNRTIIRGSCWDSGCANPPELWATEELRYIFLVRDNQEYRCLELTDHVGCIAEASGHPNYCDQSYPSGDWGRWGIHNRGTGSDVHIEDLNIHGFAQDGLNAGGFNNLTVVNTMIDGNSHGGWDFDCESCSSHSNSGDLTFTNVDIRYNGCVEAYPKVASDNTTSQLVLDIDNCCNNGNGAGCYGDGVGTPSTGGNWLVTDSEIVGNSSDGWDLLYVTAGGQSRFLRNEFYGNTGNQVKASASVWIEDNKILGTCDYLTENGLQWSGMTDCRAGGDTIEFDWRAPGQQMGLVNNTLSGAGNYIILISQEESVTADDTETFIVENNIFFGGDRHNTTDNVNLFLNQGYNGFEDVDPDFGSSNSNIAYALAVDPCSDAGFTCPSANPTLVGFDLVGGKATCTDEEECDITLIVGSPAIAIADETVTGADELDINAEDRGASWDAGADNFATDAADCDSDCSLCGTQGACEASAAFDCDATGFCCWNTDVCETTAASVCDADHCSLCLTQTPCENVPDSQCTWGGSECSTTVSSERTFFLGAGGIWNGDM